MNVVIRTSKTGLTRLHVIQTLSRARLIVVILEDALLVVRHIAAKEIKPLRQFNFKCLNHLYHRPPAIVQDCLVPLCVLNPASRGVLNIVVTKRTRNKQRRFSMGKILFMVIQC